MNIQYFKNYSPALGRDMECKLYGHGGQPILFIPCQDGRFFDFENFHMTDVWAPWIDSGEVTIFTVDTIDAIRAFASAATRTGFAISPMRWFLLSMQK